MALTAIICAGRLLRRVVVSSAAAAHRPSSMERARARAAKCVFRRWHWHTGESEAAARRRIRGSGLRSGIAVVLRVISAVVGCIGRAGRGTWAVGGFGTHGFAIAVEYDSLVVLIHPPASDVCHAGTDLVTCAARRARRLDRPDSERHLFRHVDLTSSLAARAARVSLRRCAVRRRSRARQTEDQVVGCATGAY